MSNDDIQLDQLMLDMARKKCDLCWQQFDALDEYEQMFITDIRNLIEICDSMGAQPKITRKQWNYLCNVGYKYGTTR
jgi:hypothetical protein